MQDTLCFSLYRILRDDEVENSGKQAAEENVTVFQLQT